MKRTTRYLISVGFLAAIALPPLSILAPVSVTEIENRRIEIPNVTTRRLLDPELYKEIFVYVRDANPIRASLIRVGATIDLNVFDDSPDPSRVFKGRDDWLFFRRTVTEGCSTPPNVVVSNIEDFVDDLESDIQVVVFTVAPSKFSIHPDKLNDAQFALTECARINSEHLETQLEVASLKHYVNGWEIMRRLKREGIEPYFRTDTHFNYEASIPWMNALIDEIDPIWDDSAVHELGVTEFQGNLMSFLGLVDPEPTRHVVVDRQVPPEPSATRFNGNLRRYDFTQHTDVDLIRGEAVIIGDSFMDLPEPSLVQYFESVIVIDWRDTEAVAWFLNNADDFKIVLIEVSEMDVWNLFADQDLLQRYRTSSS